MTNNFNIEGLITKKGYIEYGDKLEIKELSGVPYQVIENEYGEFQKKFVDFDCIYYGENIYKKNGEDDFDNIIIGYTTDRKIIITEILIFLTEEELEQKINELKKID